MKILVIGGTNIDIYSKSNNELLLEDSNIGSINFSIGGVAKNIAENLIMLKEDVNLLTVLGSDYFFNEVTNHFNNLKLPTIIKKSKHKTPTYLAVFKENKDFLVGINDMEALNDLNVEFISKINLNDYDLIVIDANLKEDVIKYVTENTKKPIYAEAISSNKVMKFRKYLKKVFALKCNVLEARALIMKDDLTIIELCKEINKLGVKEVYLTHGDKGSYLYKDNELLYKEALKTVVVNTSGAGDGFYAGVIYAKSNNKEELLYGNSLASIILMSEKANNEKLTKKLLESMVKRYENRN